MKKLFSIVLAIAMAVSCFAISASAAESIEGDYTFTHKIEGDVLTLTFTVDAILYGTTSGQDIIVDWWMEYDPADLVYMGDETIVAEGVEFNQPAVPDHPELGKDVYTDSGEGYTSLGLMPVLYTGEVAARDYTASISAQWKILAEVGSTVEIPVVEVSSGSFDARVWGPTSYTFVYEATGSDEPEEPTYEAPAAAEYQELAGCEVCGTEAGVRFIATVDATADVYGMYISANGTTKKLSSTDEGFKVKAETADTITFTAVIFSDLTFTVEVFEVYGNTEVKSAAGTN